jgi:hypothetical protein
MNKKVLGMILALLTVAMLTAPMLGTVEACGWGRRRRPVIASVEYSMEMWPNATQPDNFEKLTGDDIVAGYKNLGTFGNPPFVETYPPTIADYGKGGFRFTITKGNKDFELIAEAQNTIFLFVVYTDGRARGIEKWSFKIVSNDDATALGAVGDTLEGWVLIRNDKSLVTSVKGTGIFKGAHLRGDITITPYPLTTPAGNTIIFTVGVGSGLIVLPKGFP